MQTHVQTIVERTRPSAKGALTRGQIAAVITIGVVFWFTAAMTVQFGSPAGFFGPIASTILFAVSIPVCWLSVLLTRNLARLEVGQTLPGIAIGLVAATVCDAVALTWGRGLYGSDPAQVVYGAAWILWGVGFFLLFAYLDDYR